MKELVYSTGNGGVDDRLIKNRRRLERGILGPLYARRCAKLDLEDADRACILMLDFSINFQI